MKFIIPLLLLFIVGCTTTECPICPTCIYPQQINQSTESIIKPLIIYRLYAGKQPVFITTLDNENVVFNCGNSAYGPITSQDIINYVPKINKLIITNTSWEYIGGCPDILKNHMEINSVTIYDVEKDTQEYKDMISWIQPNKLIKKNEPFQLIYHNTIIDFNSLTMVRNEVYGEW